MADVIKGQLALLDLFTGHSWIIATRSTTMLESRERRSVSSQQSRWGERFRIGIRGSPMSTYLYYISDVIPDTCQVSFRPILKESTIVSITLHLDAGNVF